MIRLRAKRLDQLQDEDLLLYADVVRTRAWLGEVAALEDSLKHLRQRRTEAEEQLKPAAGPPAPCGPPGGSDRPRQIGVAWARGTWSQLGVVGRSEWFRMQP